MVELTDPRPAYQQVADSIRADIASGQYQPGDKLPSRAELTGRFEVAHMTINRAIDLLKQQGLVASQQGRGVYVVAVPEANGVDRIAVLEARVDALEREVAALAAKRLWRQSGVS